MSSTLLNFNFKVKSGPDQEFEGTHPKVYVEYSQNRHNFTMNNYRTGDDD